MFTCECGKVFENQQSFLGHKSNCDIHLKSVGKYFWTKENRTEYNKQKLIEKYGSLENYLEHLSERVKQGNSKRTDTVNYYVSHINKEEFIKEYIEENRPRKYMRDKYNVSDYMIDQIIKAFGCNKDKKQSSKLGWATKHSIYPKDNMNNWQKAQQTRILNSGSLENSYAKGMEKQQQTMFERYGVYSALNLDYLSTHRKKKHSKPNDTFAKLLEGNNIEYEREFCIGTKSYDFKVDNKLIEINPTITHNTHFIPYGDYSGIKEKYHYNKSHLAHENGYICIHIWDWDNVENVINILRDRCRVYARNCLVKEITKEQSKEFLQKYHLQGYAKDNMRIGLFFKDILVSVMTFDKPRYNKNYDYELIRYASSYEVVGGAEKLFLYFVKTYTPKSIISYCDKSKFEGKVYTNLGFTSKGVNIGKHWYNIKTGKHITDNLLRQRGFDQLLGKEYGYFGKGTSNEQLMLENGFLPVMDAGQETFIWKKSE